MLTTDARSIKTDYLYTFRFVFSLLHKLKVAALRRKYMASGFVSISYKQSWKHLESQLYNPEITNR